MGIELLCVKCLQLTTRLCDRCARGLCSNDGVRFEWTGERLCPSCLKAAQERLQQRAANREPLETVVEWMARQGLQGQGGVR